MTKLKTVQYTLVQHSGAGYAGKPGFAHAVEERQLNTQHDLDVVQRAGGLVFNSYAEAADAAEDENYPPTLQGLYPHVAGHFSRNVIDGLRIYVPLRQDVE